MSSTEDTTSSNTKNNGEGFQSVKYDGKSLQVLDQLLLPSQMVYIDVPNIQTTWNVIHKMQIRGAPLIAIVACLGLAIDLNNDTTQNEIKQMEQMHSTERLGDAIYTYIQGKMDFLATSRPTAVNLFNALNELKDILIKAKTDTTTDNDNTSSVISERMVSAVVKHAEFMLKRDLDDCKNIGKYGADAILRNTKDDEKVTIMTICNTGSLATAGYGTALGVVRAIHERNQLHAIIPLETRPYNQGSRLTCFECIQDKLPNTTLICDNMAAYYMYKNNNVKACVVGADRIAANGDTANKIGTYNLAICAKEHHIEFYIAAPFTTLDLNIKSGSDIPIEERPANELLNTSNAPINTHVWNPAFDVTPAKYITGIVTEKGVIYPNMDGVFDVRAFVIEHSPEGTVPDGTSTLVAPSGYTEQTTETLPSYIAHNIPDAMKVLDANTADDLVSIEMGDGNLNLVFIVSNKNKGADATKLVIKQALPYVRCVGESWPLTLDRAYFEYTALVIEKNACPEYVPDLYYFSRKDALIAMQYIAPPNIILRKGLIQGIRYPTMAQDLGIFCAKTLFLTSGFHLSTSELRKNVEFWSQNKDMCELTEKVIFTEPYIEAELNRWTTPQLDDDKKAIENDINLKKAATGFKHKFVTQTQALIHADLHTGSVMCSPQDKQTFVIDPEFAFYGPAAFDTGAVIANMFLSYVSQDAHRPGDDYAEWILDQIQIFWHTYEDEFITLWNDPKQHIGFAYGRDILGDDSSASQKEYMKTMLEDTLGFAGMKMLRRIVGIAHVEDLDCIEDVELRAKCERRGLKIAKTFIKFSSSFNTIEEAIVVARDTLV